VVLFRAGPASLGAVAGTGFCGGYTTFSSYTIESIRLVEQRRYATALSYLTVSALGGLAAAGIGLLVARWV
jgi:fluoride exporter